MEKEWLLRKFVAFEKLDCFKGLKESNLNISLQITYISQPSMLVKLGENDGK